jgi:hypothetical protein
MTPVATGGIEAWGNKLAVTFVDRGSALRDWTHPRTSMDSEDPLKRSILNALCEYRLQISFLRVDDFQDNHLVVESLLIAAAQATAADCGSGWWS